MNAFLPKRQQRRSSCIFTPNAVENRIKYWGSIFYWVYKKKYLLIQFRRILHNMETTIGKGTTVYYYGGLPFTEREKLRPVSLMICEQGAFLLFNVLIRQSFDNLCYVCYGQIEEVAITEREILQHFSKGQLECV